MRKNRDTPAGTVHRSRSTARRSRATCSATRRAASSMSTCRAAMTAAACRCWSTSSGYTAGGPAHTNWKNYGENLPERLDRLIADGRDAAGRRGFPGLLHPAGRQPVHRQRSPWAPGTISCRAKLPFVEAQFGCGGAGRRGVFGKSRAAATARWCTRCCTADFWAPRPLPFGRHGLRVSLRERFPQRAPAPRRATTCRSRASSAPSRRGRRRRTRTGTP